MFSLSSRKAELPSLTAVIAADSITASMSNHSSLTHVTDMDDGGSQGASPRNSSRNSPMRSPEVSVDTCRRRSSRPQWDGIPRILQQKYCTTFLWTARELSCPNRYSWLWLDCYGVVMMQHKIDIYLSILQKWGLNLPFFV